MSSVNIYRNNCTCTEVYVDSTSLLDISDDKILNAATPLSSPSSHYHIHYDGPTKAIISHELSCAERLKKSKDANSRWREQMGKQLKDMKEGNEQMEERFRLMEEQLKEERDARTKERGTQLRYEIPLNIARAADRRISRDIRKVTDLKDPSHPVLPEHLSTFSSLIINIFVSNVEPPVFPTSILPGYRTLLRFQHELHERFSHTQSVNYLRSSNMRARTFYFLQYHLLALNHPEDDFRQERQDSDMSISSDGSLTYKKRFIDPLMELAVSMRVLALMYGGERHQLAHVQPSETEVADFLSKEQASLGESVSELGREVANEKWDIAIV
ncbi:hypothetical protein PQX77_013627 [Marasmius sp. AFHP31]|nr:hypothetical protein PQX77_013627 [Marasmius sp. AFHP31]